VHGIAATPVMALLDERRKKTAIEETGDEQDAANMAV